MRNIIQQESLSIFIIVANLCLTGIIYGSYDLTCLHQIVFIISFIYISCIIYQKYRTAIDNKEYKFMKGRNLEKLFALLMSIAIIAAIYADYLVISHFS